LWDFHDKTLITRCYSVALLFSASEITPFGSVLRASSDDNSAGAVAIGIGRTDVEEVDRLNIYWAAMEARRRAGFN
jgi:hypothetical protein